MWGFHSGQKVALSQAIHRELPQVIIIHHSSMVRTYIMPLEALLPLPSSARMRLAGDGIEHRGAERVGPSSGGEILIPTTAIVHVLDKLRHLIRMHLGF